MLKEFVKSHLTQVPVAIVSGNPIPIPQTKRLGKEIWGFDIKTNQFSQRVGFIYLIHCRGLQRPEHGVPAERGARGHVGEPGAAVHLTVWEATRLMLALWGGKGSTSCHFPKLVNTWIKTCDFAVKQFRKCRVVGLILHHAPRRKLLFQWFGCIMQKLGEYIRSPCTKKIAAPPESSGTWAGFWKACLGFCKQAHHGQNLFPQKHG